MKIEEYLLPMFQTEEKICLIITTFVNLFLEQIALCIGRKLCGCENERKLVLCMRQLEEGKNDKK